MMKFWFITSFIILTIMVVFPVLAISAVSEAVVKIYAVYNTPDYSNPWNMSGPRSRTGSGAIIEGNLILTNAHVVSDVTFLQVRRHGETQRYAARVAAVSHQSDLALVEVEDPVFFDGVEPLAFGGLPETHQEVKVYGFPLGGDSLSVTRGIVSRIEHRPYVHSSISLLAGQIDAAINPGSSGGPVIVEDVIVGVVMQGIPQAQNIGYMVPSPVIDHFLTGGRDGVYHGFPSVGFLVQAMENPGMRSAYRMKEGQSGVLITRTIPGSPADGVLRSGDVLLTIGGFPVANDGSIEFRHREWTSLSYVVQKKQIGETIGMEILRNGITHSLELVLHRSMDENWLVPMERYETDPTYLIYGGIVFSPLSKDLFGIWGPDWPATAPTELLVHLFNNVPRVDGEQVVIVLRVLAADVNQGYQEITGWIVDRVNGEKIWNMKDLARMLDEQDERFYTILENDQGQQIILDSQKARDNHARILATYRIARDRSSDLVVDQSESVTEEESIVNY
ncbi:MAG TPA: serine protease [Atribacteraceae bacterium]|nr:serine protease [Atribacteraceae bacterium]